MSAPTPGDDRAAFEAGILSHLDGLYNLALWMVRDRPVAEDLVQETCLRALRFRHQFEPGTNLRAWLFQILRSIFIGQLRRGQRAGPHLNLEVLEGQGGYGAAGGRGVAGGADPFTRLDIDAALRQVPEEFRAAVVLADIEGLSMAEVAAVMHCPVGTAKSRVFRGRALLRKALAGYARPGA